MKIDGIGSKPLQQTGQIKPVEAKPAQIKDITDPVPLPPTKPEGEISIPGEIGAAASSIAGEDLINNPTLSKPVAEAVEIVLEQREKNVK